MCVGKSEGAKLDRGLLESVSTGERDAQKSRLKTRRRLRLYILLGRYRRLAFRDQSQRQIRDFAVNLVPDIDTSARDGPVRLRVSPLLPEQRAKGQWQNDSAGGTSLHA